MSSFPQETDESIQFIALNITPQTSLYVRSEWYRIFNPQTFVFPTINYCFYGSAIALEEKMLVVDDSRAILIASKKVSESEGNESSSTYSIPKRKLAIVEILTGKVIIPMGTSIDDQMLLYSNFANSIQSLPENCTPLDLLAYYIPKQSGIYLHPFFHQNIGLANKSITSRISDIHSEKYDQKKRILFGTLEINQNFQAIFNIL